MWGCPQWTRIYFHYNCCFDSRVTFSFYQSTWKVSNIDGNKREERIMRIIMPFICQHMIGYLHLEGGNLFIGAIAHCMYVFTVWPPQCFESALSASNIKRSCYVIKDIERVMRCTFATKVERGYGLMPARDQVLKGGWVLDLQVQTRPSFGSRISLTFFKNLSSSTF